MTDKFLEDMVYELRGIKTILGSMWHSRYKTDETHTCSRPRSVFPVCVFRVGFCVSVRVGCWSVPCWAVRVELACSILRVGACWCVLVRVNGRAVLRAGRVLAAVSAACWPRGNCCQPGPTFFLKQALVPGSFAAWGRLFFLRNPTIFEDATCPGQLRCPGLNFFSEIRLLLKKQLVPGSFAAWGRTFSRKSDFF